MRRYWDLYLPMSFSRLLGRILDKFYIFHNK